MTKIEVKLFEVTDDSGKRYGWTAIRGDETIGIVYGTELDGYTIHFNDRTSDHGWEMDDIRKLATDWQDSRIRREAERTVAKLNRLKDRILALEIEISDSEGIDDETKNAIAGELSTARTAVIVASSFAGNKAQRS